MNVPYQEVSRQVTGLPIGQQIRLVVDIFRYLLWGRFRQRPRFSAYDLLYNGAPRPQRTVEEINQSIRELRDEWND